jgi:hypothetical protein
MFVILNISFTVYNRENYSILYLIILLNAIWYALACLWQMTDKEIRSPRRYYRAHGQRFLTYLALFVILVYFSSFDPFSLNRAYGEIIRGIVVVSTIVTMILFNVTRLDRFICRSDIISQCSLFYDDNKRLTDFPEGYLPQMLSKQIIEMCYSGRSYRSSTNNVNDMCYNGRSNKSWQKIVEYSPYHQLWQRIEYSADQMKNNLVEKHLFTQVVEYLILVWMSQVTPCQDRISQAGTCQNKQFVDFKKKKEFLSQIKSRPKGVICFLKG